VTLRQDNKSEKGKVAEAQGFEPWEDFHPRLRPLCQTSADRPFSAWFPIRKVRLLHGEIRWHFWLHSFKNLSLQLTLPQQRRANAGRTPKRVTGGALLSQEWWKSPPRIRAQHI